MSPDAVASKLVPVMVTEFPPAVEPLVGLIDVIVGVAVAATIGIEIPVETGK